MIEKSSPFGFGEKPIKTKKTTSSKLSNGGRPTAGQIFELKNWHDFTRAQVSSRSTSPDMTTELGTRCYSR